MTKDNERIIRYKRQRHNEDCYDTLIKTRERIARYKREKRHNADHCYAWSLV